MSTATTPTFSARLLGQTEKAANAILDRQLAGTGLTEPQWVTLSLIVAAGGPVDGDELAVLLAGILKISDAEARTLITELAGAQLLQGAGADGSLATLTDVGERLYGKIRAGVTQITERLWGDLPAEDLATAGRVLSTVLERANSELAERRQDDETSLNRER
jgi:hypothetical protein